VTYQDSFIHFANRYGLTVPAFAFAADGQDQARDAAGLEKVVRDNAVPAVFAEYGFDTTLMQEVATATGAELCTLESDIQDPPGSSYFDMMRENVDEIVHCLGGG
jgi:ABC-type Zn uptake system ZnuABC Zn-binding protein ZnuA